MFAKKFPVRSHNRSSLPKLFEGDFGSVDFGCGFFAYNRKLPAYGGAFLLTVDNFSLFTYSWSFLLTVLAFYLQLELLNLQWESASNKGLKGL